MIQASPEPATILVVDDIPQNIDVLDAILGQQYKIRFALSGEKAIEFLKTDASVDLILLDVMMPGLDGFETCRRLKQNPATSRIPVIFVTALGEISDEAKGFSVGGVDYITKPVSGPVVRARVKTHLSLYDQTLHLERLVRERTQELYMTQDVTIHSLAVLAETRDNETGGHIMRTKAFVKTLAQALSGKPGYKPELTPDSIEQLYKSAPLHDIGKVGIPDAILLKPGKLTAQEFDIMKNHAVLGRDAILRAEAALKSDQSASFLRYAWEIAYTHHEKWDGSGYPQSLAGEAIPCSGRLMALADVYDALISKRVYKPPFSHKKAVEIIAEGRGSHFDPVAVETFLDVSETFREIAIRFADHEEERRILMKG